jgi:hypothetical protein
MHHRPSAAPAGSRYQDQRHYVVVASLDELRGPTHGTVKLDPWLDWSGDPRYDVDDAGDQVVLYQTVLNEAQTPDDLRRWLDGITLRRLWPSLWLPGRLRALWESRFPDLARTPRPAAG